MSFATLPGGTFGGALANQADAYADLELETLASVLGDPALSAQLSPLVATTSNIFSLAGDYAEALSDGISNAEAGRFAIDLGLTVLGMVAKAVGGAAGGALSTVVPILGDILALAFTQDYGGLHSPADTEQHWHDECQRLLRPVKGTGPGGAVYPADILVSERIAAGHGGGSTWAGPGRVWRPEVGLALVALERGGKGSDLTEKYKTAAKASGVSGLDKIGIDSKSLLALSNLRKVVELSYIARSDATVAWMLYIDMLRDLFKTGRLTETFADFLATYSKLDDGTFTPEMMLFEAIKVLPIPGANDGRALMSVNNCRRYGRPAIDALMTMVHNWTLTVEPTWNADKQKYGTMLGEARKSLERLTRVQLLAAALKHKPRVKLDPFGDPHKPRVKFF